MPLFTYFFWGWVGWGVRRFHKNIYMFYNLTVFDKSQAPYCVAVCSNNTIRTYKAIQNPMTLDTEDVTKLGNFVA